MKVLVHVIRRRVALGALAALLAVAALVGGRAAHGDLLQPRVTLGPVTVANGAATVSGTLGGNPSSLSLAINGQPVNVASNGSFNATVNLAGASDLTLKVTNPTTGDQITTSIPLTSNVIGPGGVISPDVLKALEAAAISITKPAEGFTSLDGQPLAIAGKVGDAGQLAALAVNGADVLSKLTPGGTFTQTVPGTTERVTVSATDKEGVTQTTAYGVDHTSSVIQTSQGASVSAAGANGLRIASVRYITRNVKAKKRMGMVVTVKDLSGRLVRDAIVRVRVANFQVKSRYVKGGQRIKLTSKIGQASFTVTLNKKALGKRVFMVSVAKSPTKTVNKTTSVRLPAVKRARH